MKMTEEKATEFFSIVFRGRHHIPGKVRECGYGWYINCPRDLATFDGDLLTRLVFLAHDKGYRLSINSCNMQYTKVEIYKRKRVGLIHERHPALDDAVNSWREANPIPSLSYNTDELYPEGEE